MFHVYFMEKTKLTFFRESKNEDEYNRIVGRMYRRGHFWLQ